MVWLDERAMLFDCLEFSDNLRWIDVMSELAFLVMDLDDRGRPELARRALNAYLEHTGDYAGLKNRGRGEYRGYASLAGRYTQPPPPALVITHGLSGSGKTWLSQPLLEALGAVRVRSDIERKRLHGLAPGARSGSGIDSGIYAPDASRRTYAHLAQLAATILRAGHSVIVDAAFLKHSQRDQLRIVAQQVCVPFVILDIRTPETILRQRLQQRAAQQHEVSEAGLAVLDHQLATREPLADAEQRHALGVDGAAPDMSSLERQLREHLVSA
jgi:predicted kinase